MTRIAKNDLTGRRFCRLLVVEFLPDDTKWPSYLCRCDCGVEKKIYGHALTSGRTRSCGCYSAEQSAMRSRTHGQAGKSRTGTYQSWAGMMDRGVWGGHPSFANYGAKGITVCERWHVFENFLEDMGERPRGMSIDRVDNTKGYSPDNCRWATPSEQALNTSKTRKVEYKGEVLPAKTLCERLGLSPKAIRARAVRRGNDYAKAFQSVGVDAREVFP